MKLACTALILSFEMIKTLNIAQEMALNILFCNEFLSIKKWTDRKDTDLPSQFIKTAHERQMQPNSSPSRVGFSILTGNQPKLLSILI
jgi:hypothetical protein